MAQYANSRTMKGFGSWQHFLKFLWEKDGQSAQCKLCKNKLKTVGGSTKGCHEHQRRMHNLFSSDTGLVVLQ